MKWLGQDAVGNLLRGARHDREVDLEAQVNGHRGLGWGPAVRAHVLRVAVHDGRRGVARPHQVTLALHQVLRHVERVERVGDRRRLLVAFGQLEEVRLREDLLVLVRRHFAGGHDVALVVDHAAGGRGRAADQRDHARLVLVVRVAREVGVLERLVDPLHHAREDLGAHRVAGGLRAAGVLVQDGLDGRGGRAVGPRVRDARGAVLVAHVQQVGVAVEVLVDHEQPARRARVLGAGVVAGAQGVGRELLFVQQQVVGGGRGHVGRDVDDRAVHRVRGVLLVREHEVGQAVAVHVVRVRARDRARRRGRLKRKGAIGALTDRLVALVQDSVVQREPAYGGRGRRVVRARDQVHVARARDHRDVRRARIHLVGVLHGAGVVHKPGILLGGRRVRRGVLGVRARVAEEVARCDALRVRDRSKGVSRGAVGADHRDHAGVVEHDEVEPVAHLPA